MATTLFSAYRWLTFGACDYFRMKSRSAHELTFGGVRLGIGSLIICNSIICSIAAWNLSFFVVRGNSGKSPTSSILVVGATEWNSCGSNSHLVTVAVDTYLIFTSALALVLFFPV